MSATPAQPSDAETSRLRRAAAAASRSVERIVTISFVLLSLCLAAIAVFSLRSISLFPQSVAWVDRAHEVIDMFNELELDVREGESALRAYMLTGDLSQRDAYRNQAFEELNYHLSELRLLAADNPAQLSRLDPIEAMLRQRIVLMEKARTEYEADPTNATRQASLIRPGVELTDKVVARLHEFRDAERQLLSAHVADRASEAERAMQAILASGFLGLGCAGLGLFIVLRGLQKRRMAEERLRESHDEKEILLREVHHRVKNNLQVISSLLSLNSEKLKNPEAKLVFNECRDRIHLMARLHQQLYVKGQFARVDFGEHLREIINMLVQSHAPAGCDVKLEVQADPTVMDLDTAVALGLIASEVILNSLKHAFVGRRNGTLSIELHDGARREMVVSDDGTGLPAGLDPKSSPGLGLELVVGLSRQIQAEAIIENRQPTGTCTTIRFPATITEESQGTENREATTA